MSALFKNLIFTGLLILLSVSVVQAEFYYEAAEYNLSGHVFQIIPIDVNNDSVIDLACANGGGYFSVLIGNGDGTFAAAVDYPSGAHTMSVIEGSFNADTIIDFACGNVNDSTISIFLGNGDGTFQSAITTPKLTYPPNSIAAGKYDADSLDDIAFVRANSSTTDTLGILFNTGSGVMSSETFIEVDRRTKQVLSADIDLDGDGDILVLHREILTGAPDHAIWVFKGNGDGTFTAPYFPDYLGAETSMNFVDANFDGFMDLTVSTGQVDVSGSFGFVSLNDSTGNFSESIAVIADVSESFLEIVAGYFNKDTLIDIAASTNNGLVNRETYIYLNNGASLMPVKNTLEDWAHDLVATDFNGDGCTDLMISDNWVTNFTKFSWSDCCCRGIRGNVDGDFNDEINISDLLRLVNLSFVDGPWPDCNEEIDVDGSFIIDIGDIVYLVEYMFGGGPAPVACGN